MFSFLLASQIRKNNNKYSVFVCAGFAFTTYAFFQKGATFLCFLSFFFLLFKCVNVYKYAFQLAFSPRPETTEKNHFHLLRCVLELLSRFAPSEKTYTRGALLRQLCECGGACAVRCRKRARTEQQDSQRNNHIHTRDGTHNALPGGKPPRKENRNLPTNSHDILNHQIGERVHR